MYSIFLSPFPTVFDLYIALSHKTDQYLHTSFHIILLVIRKHWKCQDQSSSTGIVAPSQMKRRLWWKVLIKRLPSLKENKFQTWMLEASLLCHRLMQLSISDMVACALDESCNAADFECCLVQVKESYWSTATSRSTWRSSTGIQQPDLSKKARLCKHPLILGASRPLGHALNQFFLYPPPSPFLLLPQKTTPSQTSSSISASVWKDESQVVIVTDQLTMHICNITVAADKDWSEEGGRRRMLKEVLSDSGACAFRLM